MIKFLSLFLLFCTTLCGEIYHTQDRQTLKAAIQTSIKQAHESILIFTFTLSDSSTIQLLNQKAQEGVAVTVVIDKEHALSIQTHGHPNIQIVTRTTGEGRIHHKTLVIDKKHVWLGSANITDSAFSHQENLMVQLESPDLAKDLHHEKIVFEGIASRNPSSPKEYLVDEQRVHFGLLPHDGWPPKLVEVSINKEAKKLLLELIKNAKSTIHIAMMVWTDNDLAEAVKRAHQRGVTVLILAADLGGSIPDLQRSGIQVKVNPQFRLMHNKFMYIDRQTLVNGSANWSKSSFSRNDESFLVLHTLSQKQQKQLDDYWEYLWPRN